MHLIGAKEDRLQETRIRCKNFQFASIEVKVTMDIRFKICLESAKDWLMSEMSSSTVRTERARCITPYRGSVCVEQAFDLSTAGRYCAGLASGVPKVHCGSPAKS